MHFYTSNANERRIVPLILVGLSVGLAWFLHLIAEKTHFTPPWWFDMPSVIAFYGILYALLDKVLWKKRVVRTLARIRTPDLNGSWTGYTSSSYDDYRNQHQASVKIVQTWTEILIKLESPNSKSCSLIAGISFDDPSTPLIIYEYYNEPQPSAVATMHSHKGTANLNLLRSDEGAVLEGDYYTGRDRGMYGHIRVSRATAIPKT